MPSETRLFLELLFASKPDDLYLLLWTLPNKRSHWFQDIEGATQFAESRREQDLYIGVGLSREDYGPARRCPSEEVAGIVGLWADLDLKSEAHSKTVLPATVEDALQILPEQLPPTFVVRTGNGAHAWWLFREPLIFGSEEERRDAGNLALRWQSLLRAKAAARGWAFDRLADLARVLRVPGTRNCKDAANPKPVEIYLQTDRRYNPSDLAEYLEDQRIPDAEDQERTARLWKEQFANKPLTIDPSATVPEDRLARLIAADARFQKTWLRQREDLKDKSQSGYDLAIANFGFRAGVSEQGIVDLIIQHRRIHSKSPRTTLDYFQRTLAKASKSNDKIAPISGADSTQTVVHPHAESETSRALLCEEISHAIGVRLLRIVKVAGQNPTYRVELEDCKIGFASIDKLISQHSFRMKIASAVDHLVPKVSPRTWERVAQTMLSALTIEDGGDEADLVGGAKMYVERYLSETPFIDAEEHQSYQTKFKPTVYEGQIAIRAHDLQQHINKTWGENRALQDVTSMLSAIGASSSRLKRTGSLRDQSRWFLPSSEFDPHLYAENDGEAADAKPSWA